MRPFYLWFAKIEDWFLGPIEGEEHEEERREYLELYTVEEGERVRIRPLLPESWHGLGTYLPAIGCPPPVVQAIKEGVRRVVGDPDTATLTAQLHDDALNIYLVWEKTGKVIEVALYFLDAGEE